MGEDASTWSNKVTEGTGSVICMDKVSVQRLLCIQNLGLYAVTLRRGLAVVLIKGAKLSCAKSIVSCDTCKLRGVCLIHHRLTVALKALKVLEKLDKFVEGKPLSTEDMDEMMVLAKDKKYNG